MTDKKFQLMWSALHFYAAVLAIIAAGMHIASGTYHLKRGF